MIEALTKHIHKISAKRVVIESITYIALHSAESELNAEEYLREILLSLTNVGYTTLITSGLPSTEKEQSIYGMEERLVEGVITLDIDEPRNKRFIYIRKMKKTGVNLSKYEYSINANSGITFDPIKNDVKIAKVGGKSPEFSIEAYYNNESVKLSSLDYRGRWLVLVFYPGDFTFVCPTELSEIAERYEAFKSLNAEVLSISMNTISSHKTWRNASSSIAKIQYPMGSDVDGEVCGLFGVLTNDGTTDRATFIIDPKGTIVAEEMNVEKIGRSTEEILRKLSAAKYVDEHPNEECPEGWKPGEPTIKTTES
jgi:peroxiredoxin (alkyl hydroperoxide reductase subunit C)